MLISLLMTMLPSANASTFYFSDIGVKGYARAGAFIASVDDVTAQWYNPAAFTRVEKGMFGIQVSYVHHNVAFTRAAIEDQSFDEVLNNSQPTIIPHGGIAYRFHDLTAYVGFTSPFADYLTYPDDGPQRYSLIKSSVLQTFTGGVLAYKVNDWVSIGVGASWNIMEIQQSRNISMYSSNAPDESEDAQYDVGFSLQARDNFGVAYNISTLVEPPDKKWAFGLMLQPPTYFEAEGSMEADFSEHFLYGTVIMDEVASDDSITMNIHMPLIIRSGFAFRPNENVELELSVVWENWSTLPNPLIVDNVDMNIELSLSEEPEVIEGPIEIPNGYRDTLSIRFGGDWVATPHLQLRSGVLFEQGGIPTSSINVSSIDRDKIGYGLGASYIFSDSFSMDLGFFQSFFGTWTIEDSSISRLAAEIDLSDFDNIEVNLIEDRVVGNGTYSSNVFYGGLSGTYNF